MFHRNSPQLPWFKEYKVFGIPKSLEPYPNQPVFEMLDHAAKKYRKNGLIQFNYKMKYPEVKDHVDRLAAALCSMGLRKGDRAATLLPTSMQFAIADFAISKAGLVHIPMSSLEPVRTLEHKCNQGTPKALFCLDTNLDVAKKLLESGSIRHLILTKLEDYSLNPPAHHEKVDMEGAVWMTDLISGHPPNPPAIDFDVEKDLELILFTGGTTGLPKGCMLTHRNIYANALQNSWGLGAAHKLTKGAITVLLGLPFFHSYGHMMLHTMTLQGFNQILIPDPRDTAGMVEMIKQHYPLIQFGVPTQFMKISEEELKGIGLLGISGSAPLPPDTQKKYEKKSSGGIMEGYGLSEMSPVTHLNTSIFLRIFGGRIPLGISNFFINLPGVSSTVNGVLRLVGAKTIGFLLCSGISLLIKATQKEGSSGSKKEKRGTSGIPFPDTMVKLVDVATGMKLSTEEIRAGNKGELCLNGPQRMLGYWPDPESGMDEEGYIHTGDVVTVDERGYFYIVDRTKDMINVSGYKVYSREIDDVLYDFPATEHAATVGVPDPEREGSERVVVYIQLKSGYKEKIQSDEIIAYLKTRIAKYAIPKQVNIVNEMPMTEVQKINKKAIREMAIQKMAL